MDADDHRAAEETLTPAQKRVAGDGGHWLVSGPPRAGQRATLRAWLVDALADGYLAERVLLVAPEQAAAARLTTELGLPGVTARGFPGFAQQLIAEHWPAVAEWLGSAAPEPEFLLFDLTQYLALGSYREAPGALRGLTIREDRLIAQLIDTMDLAAAHGLDDAEAWRRTARGMDLPADTPAIAAAAQLARGFRVECVERGLLPFSVQLEAAGWLLGESHVRLELLARFDVIAVDGLDELAPVAVARLLELAAGAERALLNVSPDGGLRWLLGASVARSLELCREAVRAGDFRALLLRHAETVQINAHIDAAGQIVDLALTDHGSPPRAMHGWTLHMAERTDELADQVAALVAERVRDGVEPGRIALIAPALEPLLLSELSRRLAHRDIPLHVERRVGSLTDDPAARVCLTALRCLPATDRPPTPVELADLIETLAGCNPIAAQRWVRVLHDRREGLRPPERITADLPEELERLLTWRASIDGAPPAMALDALGALVLENAGEQSASLLAACGRLTSLARRYVALLPELAETLALNGFLRLATSPLVASPDPQAPPPTGVSLSTPYAFLTHDRTVDVQCWLDVANPSWWTPTAQLLCNPQALAARDPREIGDLLAEERFRTANLRRLLRNLAARCDGELHAFAARSAPDGGQLDGPLLEGFLLAGVPTQ